MAAALTVAYACDGQLAGGADPSAGNLAGTYLLQSVDGVPLPVRLAGSGDCPPDVIDGELGLSPRAGETRPVYGWTAYTRASCASFSAQPTPDVLAADVGEWSAGAGRVDLRSGRGLDGLAADVRDSAGTVVLTFSAAGRAYAWRRARYINQPLGVLAIAVVDEQGRAVNGASLEVRASDGIVVRGATNSDRPFAVEAAEGDVTVRVAPPAGYVVPSSQPNPATASAVVGRTTEVRVLLAGDAP